MSYRVRQLTGRIDTSYQEADVISTLTKLLCEGCYQYPECHAENGQEHDYGSMIECMESMLHTGERLERTTQISERR